MASPVYTVIATVLFLCLAKSSTCEEAEAIPTGSQESVLEDILDEMSAETEEAASTELVEDFEEFLDDTVGMQQSQHMLCMFGLQNVVIQTLNNTLYDARQYDPLPLGEIPDYYLKEGTLEGLSSLKNISALEVQCGVSTVTFVAEIRIDSPYVHFNWEKRIIFLLEGQLWVKASELEVEIVLEMDSGFTFSLKHSKIKKLTGFKFGFTGLGPLNPFVRGTVNVLEKIWKGKVLMKLGKIIEAELRKEIAKLDNPLS